MLGVAMGRDAASFPAFTADGAPSNVSITWAQTLGNVTQNWNTSFFLDANATNSADCTVASYSTNNTAFPINATSGVVSFAANMSKTGVYALRISATDSCTNVISQNITVNITYNTITITGVVISPASNNGTQNLTCTVTANNTDGGLNTTTISWFKNATLQAGLSNTPTVLAPGNFTAGDIWICSGRLNDTITTTAWYNSTSVTITTDTPSESTSGGGGGGGGGGSVSVAAPVTQNVTLVSSGTETQEGLSPNVKYIITVLGISLIVLVIVSAIVIG
jgi:hypothetical protein